jgi:hypothetical protein
MKLDRYELSAGQNLTAFEFLSEGRKGKIIKVIQFQQMNFKNLYNLAFGDKNLVTGQIDDKVVTDNGDAEKVLATVVSALYAFANQYPNAWVYATGSTAARTRLYQIGINKYFDIVAVDFEIMGEHLNEWEWYKKGKNYQAFAVKRKNTTFD